MILRTADFPADQEARLVDDFEAAVYARTLKTLLALLPEEQGKKLNSTMHFQPDFFLDRVLAILQAFATPDQIAEVMEKTAEETFLEFFDTFVAGCNAEQKQRIDLYLSTLEPS
jgi:hypothetical protein